MVCERALIKTFVFKNIEWDYPAATRTIMVNIICEFYGCPIQIKMPLHVLYF